MLPLGGVIKFSQCFCIKIQASRHILPRYKHEWEHASFSLKKPHFLATNRKLHVTFCMFQRAISGQDNDTRDDTDLSFTPYCRMSQETAEGHDRSEKTDTGHEHERVSLTRYE